MNVKTIGIDLVKLLSQIQGVDEHGKAAVQQAAQALINEDLLPHWD